MPRPIPALPPSIVPFTLTHRVNPPHGGSPKWGFSTPRDSPKVQVVDSKERSSVALEAKYALELARLAEGLARGCDERRHYAQAAKWRAVAIFLRDVAGGTVTVVTQERLFTA